MKVNTGKPMAKNTKISVIVIAAAVLAACGGGGGGDTTSTTTTGTPTAIVPSVTTAGNLALSVPAPTYAAGSVELSMFNQLNDARLNGGFGMLAQNTKLDQAATNHANYLITNFYNSATNILDSAILAVDPATGLLNGHIEKAGNPGFTGVKPADRVKAAGYNSPISQEVVSFGNMEPFYNDCVGQFLTSVFHRTALLSTYTTEVGMSVVGTVPNTSTSICDIEPSTLVASGGIPATGWVGLYPYPKQTGLALAMTGEYPDPVPSSPIKGNPVSIAVEINNTLVVNTFVLSDSKGTPVPVKLLTNADFPAYLQKNTAYIVPTSALVAATTYTVSFAGTNNGVALSRTWNFTTK